MARIPYSFLPHRILKLFSRPFLNFSSVVSKLFPSLKLNLIRAGFHSDDKEYISMCIVSILIFFFISSFSLVSIFRSFGFSEYYLFVIFAAFLFSIFIFFQQIIYPKIIVNKKIRNIERNLFSVLQSILVQINSGVPLFNVLVNISKGDYGEVAEEFSIIVKEINTGKSQIEALSESAVRNPSIFYRRALWQIVNGMKAGATISNIVKETLDSLSQEQIIQIQSYGSQLNPLAMFYMLMAVIVPSLSITLIIVMSSFMSLSEATIKVIFWGFYTFIVFIQIMFLGIIKSRRPNLMSD